MNPQRFASLKRVFLEAKAAPPARRAGLLARRCGDDTELLETVTELLALDAEPDRALDQPALGPDFVMPRPDTLATDAPVDRCGWVLGNYRLLERIAEGGMGSVYRAEQTQPRRSVAVKLLRAMDAAPSAVARFREEAELLGRLQHPGIAQVFEAGTAEHDGAPQPFIAMEWIDGVAFTEFAEQQGLDTRARIDLLIAVGEAVQHAHERGVLHRDLKPSNILIDQAGRPKVIDFGIAAALDTAGAVGFTAGTPAYLAPELLSDGDIAAAPRTDVYALGMVARQLLPTAAGGIHRGDLRAVIDKSTEPRPEHRYQTVGELTDDLRRCLRGEPVAAVRRSWLARGMRLVRRRRTAVAVGATGLLLAVAAASALEWGDRQRDTADRVEAYLLAVLSSAAPTELGGEATLAALLRRVDSEVDQVFRGQPEIAVVVRTKLAWLDHRHGALDRAASQAEAALAAGRSALGDHHPATLEAGNVLAMIELERGDLQAAEALLRDVMAVAPEASVRTRAALDLSRVLAQWGRFGEARGLLRDLTLHADVGVADAGDGDAARPLQSLARADARGRLLDLAAGGADDPAHATELRRSIYEGYRRLLGPDAPQTIEAAGRLAVQLCDDAETRGEGMRLMLDVHTRCEVVYGPEHPYTLQALHDLGYGRATTGDLPAAITTCRQAWQLRSDVLGPDHLQTLCSLNNVARFSSLAGQEEAAAAHFDELSRRSRRILSADHWYRGIFAINRGRFLLLHADLEGAEAELTDGTTILAACLDDDASPRLRHTLLAARINLALAKQRRGDVRTALVILEETHAEYVRILGAGHYHTMRSAQHLAEALHASGATERAEQMQREELVRRQQLLGEVHDRTLETTIDLAYMLRARGAVREALQLLSDALRAAEGTGARRLPTLLCQIALCQQESGNLDEAKAKLSAAAALLADAPSDHPQLAQLASARGDILLTAEDWAGAEAAYRDAITRSLAILGPTNAEMGRLRNNLAGALYRQSRHEAAGVEWQEALAVRRRVLGEGHPDTLITAGNVAQNLFGLGEFESALERFQDLIPRAERTLADSSFHLAMLRSGYAACLTALGRDADALVAVERSVVGMAGPDGDLDRVAPSILIQCRMLYQKLGRDPAAALEQLQLRARAAGGERRDK